MTYFSNPFMSLLSRTVDGKAMYASLRYHTVLEREKNRTFPQNGDAMNQGFRASNLDLNMTEKRLNDGHVRVLSLSWTMDMSLYSPCPRIHKITAKDYPFGPMTYAFTHRGNFS